MARHHPLCREAAGGWQDRAFARKVAYLPQSPPDTYGLLVQELVALGRYPWHGALGRFGSRTGPGWPRRWR